MSEIDIVRIQETLASHGYEYIKFIGKGSFSSVLLCQSKKYNQLFAVKRAIQDRLTKFEYDTLISLNHPNIIRLYDAFNDKDAQYLVMEYCPNETLRQRTNLPYDAFIYYAKQILEAIAYCHANNIAHRDIKPDNIFLDQYDHVKLADFGLAKQFTDESKSTEKCGSLIFLAPEVLQYQEVCPFKADIWALGITFFFMATGKYPFKNKIREDLKRSIIFGELDYGDSQIDQKIRFLINKMTTKNPKARPTADQLLKLQIFLPIPTKKTTLLLDLTRRSSYTTGCSNQSSLTLYRSNTFNINSNSPDQTSDDNEDKKSIPLNCYRNISLYPNLHRMKSRNQTTKPS